MKNCFYHALLLGASFLAWNSHADTPPPTPIAVKVVDHAGQPVEGATVSLYGSANSQLNIQWKSQTEEQRTTDAKGLASFSISEITLFTLVASKPGLSVGWTFNYTGLPGGESGDQILELTLTAPNVVSGIVQDASGQPVSDAEIWVCLANQSRKRDSRFGGFNILNSQLGRRYLSTQSGPDGSFSINGLPAETTFVLAAAKSGLAIDQLPTSRDPDNLNLRVPQTNMVLKLKPAGIIEGLVVEEATGAPVSGAFVSLAAAGFSTSIHDPVATGADGRFRLTDLPAGEHILRTIIGTNQFADWVCEQVAARVESGATNRDAKITASRGGILEVSIRDSGNNQPIDHASVVAAPETFDIFASGLTAISAQGKARFRLSPGNYMVLITKKGLTSRQERVSVESGQTNQIEALLKPELSITGTVLNPDGKPAPKIRVSSSSNPQSNIQSDGEGRFKLVNNRVDSGFGQGPKPECILVARDPDRNLAALAIPEEEETNVVLRLESGISLTGKVTDAQGKALTNAEVTLMIQTQRTGAPLEAAPILVNAQGQFEVKGLPPNQRYYIMARAKGYGQDNRSLATQDTAGPRVNLDPFELLLADQRIAGIIVDSDDKPVAGASIYTYGGKQPNKSSRTDSKGRFTIEEICAGTINLSANLPRGGGFGNTSAEAGDTNITIRIGEQRGFASSASTGAGKFSGTVIDPEGRPAPKVVVFYFPFHGTDKKTDTNGTFKLNYNNDEWRYMQNLQRVVLARDLERNLAAALDVEADTTNAEVRLEPAWSVTGRVTDVNGKAIPNSEVSLSLMAGNIGSSIGESMRANANGSFEIKALPAGRRFYLNVSAPGYGRESRNLEFGDNEMRLDLEPFQLILADQRIAGVVVDENEKPVPGAYIYCYENKQPQLNAQTDSKGRFRFDKVCPGSIRLSVNSQSGSYAQVTAEGGDTNILIQLSSSSGGRPVAPRAASLKGKPLPDIAPLGLTAVQAPSGHPVLALLMDAEQRPSRRALNLLTDQAAMLKEKGVTVIVIQAGAMAEEAFNEWKEGADIAFPVGRMKEKPEKARAAWGASALPWLILTDKDHRVTAEGFALEELESNLNAIIQ